MRLTLFIFIAMLAVSGRAQTPERGNAMLRLTQQFISSDSYYNAGPLNETDKIRTNSIYTTTLYGEYGLTDQLAISVSLPVLVRSVVNDLQFNQSGNVNPGSAVNSVGDAEVTVRFRLWTFQSFEVTGFGALGLPLGKRGDVSSELNPATGDGEFNQMLGVNLNQSVSSFLFSGYVRFNNRTEGYSNEIRYGIHARYGGEKCWFTARYNVIESTFNDIAIPSTNGVYSNHREAFMPGAEFQYRMTNASLLASVDFIAAGRNTLDAPLWCVGVQLRLPRSN